MREVSGTPNHDAGLTQMEKMHVSLYRKRLIQNCEDFISFSLYAKVCGEQGLLRHPNENDEEKLTTFEQIAIESDGSGYPMFPEEVEDFVNDLRVRYCCPTFIDDLCFRGVPITEILTHTELVCFCVHMETLEKGSGFYVYGIRGNL